MKKSLLTLALVLCSCLNVFSQATSLTIDCQNPGWLSNMIPYGDQQTLQNLRVTGAINKTDIEFIQELCTYSLNGVIDLEDVLITDFRNDSIATYLLIKSARVFKSPKFLKGIKDGVSLTGEACDTLILGGEHFGTLSEGNIYQPKVLILREGLTTINESIFSNFSKNRLTAVKLPKTIKEIKAYAFYNNTNLKEVSGTDSLYRLGRGAFKGTKVMNDTCRVPLNLDSLYFNSFNIAKVYYIGEKTSYIDNNDYNQSRVFDGYGYRYPNYITSSNNLIFHISRTTPPKVELDDYLSSNNVLIFKNSTVYVPREAIQAYKKEIYEGWRNYFYAATILAEPTPLKALTLNHHELLMGTNETYQLSCSFIPSDASNKYVTWVSSNNDVATVSYGDVSAKAIGEAYIYVISNENPEIKDSCLVTVVVPVEGITISQNECTLAVGSNLKLETAVNPANATNKKVLWNSSNESVCTVKDGLITAIAKGTSIITATTEESNFRANCTVTVVQPVTNITLDHSTYELHSIGDSGKLTATVEPEDASNKDVTWKSSNESVCIVSNGTIIAVGYGEAVIIATSVDGGHMAICTVTVDNKTAVGNIDTRKATYKVFNLQGIEKVQFQKGINIIRFKDGTTKKILIK